MSEFLSVLSPTQREIEFCMFHSWYPLFKKSSIKSIIIALEESFIAYLGEDSIILPKSANAAFGVDQLSDDEDEVRKEASEEEGEFSEEENEGEEGDNVVHHRQPQLHHDFPELDAQIKRAIDDLDGEVFVKLNWSAPQDAAWMNGGSLKCYRPADVYLLLKSSDRITFDIEHMLSYGKAEEAVVAVTGEHAQPSASSSSPIIRHRPARMTLVIRKWSNLYPSKEFRLFVRSNSLVGRFLHLSLAN